MTLKGAAATRRKRARKLPKTRAELIRARRTFCKKKGTTSVECNLEEGSFMRRDVIKIFRQKILTDAIFPSQVTRGRKKSCTFYVTKDENTGEGLPPYSEYGQYTSRGKYTMWSYCDGAVVGDHGHKTKATAVQKAKRAAGFDPGSYARKQKRRRRRAEARALS